uniref:Ribulose-bisphosphate carboxylase-lysine N-methyltransferase n=2 Tax=Rhizophora mucronata TaxID=61149 RepID=A0A2P2ILD1_RHIMU
MQGIALRIQKRCHYKSQDSMLRACSHHSRGSGKLSDFAKDVDGPFTLLHITPPTKEHLNDITRSTHCQNSYHQHWPVSNWWGEIPQASSSAPSGRAYSAVHFDNSFCTKLSPASHALITEKTIFLTRSLYRRASTTSQPEFSLSAISLSPRFSIISLKVDWRSSRTSISLPSLDCVIVLGCQLGFRAFRR